MSSKQEKLAAARKKLKEFQGKQREPEILKPKIVPEAVFPKSNEEHSQLSLESSPAYTPTIEESSKLVVGIPRYQDNVADLQRSPLERKTELKPSDIFMKPIKSPITWLEGNEPNYNSNKDMLESGFTHIEFSSNIASKLPENASVLNCPTDQNLCGGDVSNAINNNYSASELIDDANVYQSSIYRSSTEIFKGKSESVTPEMDFKKNFTQSNNISNSKDIGFTHQYMPREHSGGSITSNQGLDDIIRPLQTELQNHAQTINILVQQRNEAQSAVTHAQNLLSEKSEEISQQKKQIQTLDAVINELNKTLYESDERVKTLTSENEMKIHQFNETSMSYHNIKKQYDSKEEECLELKRKYEEKNKECQQLVYSLNEAQSQLSLCQIQIQNQMQAVTDDNSVQMMQRISVLENENANLNQQCENFKKQLETANSENELSSQKFKTYAQQCNSELNALHSELKELRSENEKLKQINQSLPTFTPETEKIQETDPSQEEYKSEIADLHIQINSLTEEKNILQRSNQKLESENVGLRTEHEKKDNELANALTLLKEVEAENKKLLLEVETPQAREKLLAAIESDKVAAAKAVSQNQKLKNQIMELEEAFVKISQEKLELTDQLSHEKHVNKELQNKLEGIESLNRGDKEHDHHNHHHEHGDHHHHHEHSERDGECSSDEKEEPLVNDSQEIDELKRIIRQLQDDKVELKSRLNLLMPQLDEKEKNGHEQGCIHGHNDLEPRELNEENAKIRLQQMEEKVRKTMNEIALLDEEKEKLEHLVLQLQGETETIGEYITLYQKQRMVLKQRAQEKDNQLIQLSKDKEELKNKLHDLDELVQHLLNEKNGDCSVPPVVGASASETLTHEESDSTAVKIRALINEIGSTNLVNSQSVIFKHCSCCSGRLITI
ncbi:hypothetical protein RUM43_008847 [Polyplax serrata]|uniref:Golgin subfamily A conserved domain-containing protein n=1 Tax=Polyplax serrata TaxID=468196 RepID=A0AAN8NUB6_POLSC